MPALADIFAVDSMLPLIANSAIRAWRANEQGKAIHAEVEDFAKSNPYRLVYSLNSETGEYSVRIAFLPINPMWSVRIGEMLHDWRASLDNAICDLILANDQVPDRESAFPIVDQIKFWEQGGSPGKARIDGVSEAVAALVECAQPFQARNYGLDPRATPLWALRALSDIDKHRMLHPSFPAARAVNQVSITYPDDFKLIDAPITKGDWLSDGAPVFRVQGDRTLCDDEVRMDAQLCFRVAFDEATVKEVPAVKGLDIFAIFRCIDDEVKAVEMALRAVAEIDKGVAPW